MAVTLTQQQMTNLIVSPPSGQKTLGQLVSFDPNSPNLPQTGTPELSTYLNDQGSYEKSLKELNSLKAATAVLNREFHGNWNKMSGSYNLPYTAINQDLLLFGFYITYLFLMIVLCMVAYKNTQSAKQTLYGFIGGIFLLFIITGILYRMA
jgi:hypothetical protein